MSFTISARAGGRQVTHHHTSMIGALDQAMTLLTAGLSDVIIADPCGNRATAATLYRTLFQPGPRRTARGAEPRRCAAALA